MKQYDDYLRWRYRGGHPNRFARLPNRASAIAFAAPGRPAGWNPPDARTRHEPQRQKQRQRAWQPGQASGPPGTGRNWTATWPAEAPCPFPARHSPFARSSSPLADPMLRLPFLIR